AARLLVHACHRSLPPRLSSHHRTTAAKKGRADSLASSPNWPGYNGGLLLLRTPERSDRGRRSACNGRTTARSTRRRPRRRGAPRGGGGGGGGSPTAAGGARTRPTRVAPPYRAPATGARGPSARAPPASDEAGAPPAATASAAPAQPTSFGNGRYEVKRFLGE